jgi:hypothetical protein
MAGMCRSLLSDCTSQGCELKTATGVMRAAIENAHFFLEHEKPSTAVPD